MGGAHGELRVYPEFTEGNQVSGDTSSSEVEGAGEFVFSQGVDKPLKPARVALLLQSVQVALGSTCTWTTTSVRNKGDTSL